MTHLLHRQIHGELPVAVGGRGVEPLDSTGRTYIDACGGSGISCPGPGRPGRPFGMHCPC